MTSQFGKIVIIANPKSGRGRAGAALKTIERLLRDEGRSYRVVQTTRPGDATEAVRHALQSGERYMVALGGDGTVHEVVNGMLQDDQPMAPDAVLGVIAGGSGCDFIKSFNLPADTAQAVCRLLSDDIRSIDVGKVKFTSGATEVSRYFINVAEIGLGGSVAARASNLASFLGPAKYFLGFWLTLPRFQPRTMRIIVNGQEFEWRAHNLVAANCRFIGGGMHISPKSVPDDGILDVLVMVGPKSDAFTILPKVYRGKHLPHPRIKEMKASQLRVETDLPLQIEADGEILGLTPVELTIIPNAIRLKI